MTQTTNLDRVRADMRAWFANLAGVPEGKAIAPADLDGLGDRLTGDERAHIAFRVDAYTNAFIDAAEADGAELPEEFVDDLASLSAALQPYVPAAAQTDNPLSEEI